MVKGKRWRGWPATKQPGMKQREGLSYSGGGCTVARPEKSSWENVFVVANSQQQFVGSCNTYIHLSNILLKFGDSCCSTNGCIFGEYEEKDEWGMYDWHV